MLTTDQKGAIAETAVAHAAVKLGLGVSRPVNEGERYDLILDLRPRLLRLQVKWAPRAGDVIVVRAQSARRTREGLVTRGYSSTDIDGLAAYCPDVDRCYFLPARLVEQHRHFHLRLEPPRNGQRAGIVWATHFEFSQIDWANPEGCLGAIAQLEERLRGTQEVAGSSPASSTSNASSRRATIGSHQFRNHFGYHMERAASGASVVITRHGRPYAELGPPSVDAGGASATVPT